MKYLLVSFFVLNAFFATAQNPISELDSNKIVSGSNANGNVIDKRDTLICSNIRAIVATLDENIVSGTKTQAVYLQGDTDVLVILDWLSYTLPTGKKEYYTHFEFPRLLLTCDVKHTSSNYNPHLDLCRFNLINQYGLDTNQVFLFCTIKGQLSEEELKGKLSKKDTLKMLRSVIAKRNLNGEIVIKEENIYQDGIVFASYVADTLIGQKGPAKHFLIYNTKSVLVCSATEPVLNTHQWNLLTYKDNKFHTIVTKGTMDLKEILEYLILHKYI